jgi:GNAT superfamily N-acetyltransferase
LIDPPEPFGDDIACRTATSRRARGAGGSSHQALAAVGISLHISISNLKSFAILTKEFTPTLDFSCPYPAKISSPKIYPGCRMAVRKMQRGDLASVLALMQRHAHLENYDDIFAVDEQALNRLRRDSAKPAINIVVSENSEGEIVGFALYFIIEFTFRNRPMLYLNDLMVDEAHRRRGIARELMAALCREAMTLNCFRIKWGVSSANTEALAFYESIGAIREGGKFYYTLDERAFRR